MDNFSVVITTCPGTDVAQPIIEALLQERLAACIQVIPSVMSHYIWDGAVQHDSEVLLIIKGMTENYKAIEDTIVRLHPYEVAEIIRLPIEAGLDKYLAWLTNPV